MLRVRVSAQLYHERAEDHYDKYDRSVDTGAPACGDDVMKLQIADPTFKPTFKPFGCISGMASSVGNLSCFME
ncbi:hypothetical protein OROGR_013893 [Orobanche gracilis]